MNYRSKDAENETRSGASKCYQFLVVQVLLIRSRVLYVPNLKKIGSPGAAGVGQVCTVESRFQNGAIVIVKSSQIVILSNSMY